MSRSDGFTLIEMAIALVVIGAVLVGVLQGRALIDNAEYKSFKHSLHDYAEAFYAFRERYNALPGDFIDADTRIKDGLTNGSGDGVIDHGPQCQLTSDESCLAWQHLRAASLLGGNPGPDGADAPPDHPYGDVVSGYFSGTEGNEIFGHKMLVVAIPAEIAQRLDRELDDGVCNRGRISLNPNSDCTENDDWPDAAAVNLVYAL